MFCPSCGRNRKTEYFEFEGDRYYECPSGHCWAHRPPEPEQFRWRDVTRAPESAWRTQTTTPPNGISVEMIRRWMEQAPATSTVSTSVGVDASHLRGQQWTSTPVSVDIETTGDWHATDELSNLLYPPVSEGVSADPNPTQAQETPQTPNESEG